MIAIKTNLENIPDSCRTCMCKMRVTCSYDIKAIQFEESARIFSVINCALFNMDISQNVADNTKHKDCGFFKVDNFTKIKND